MAGEASGLLDAWPSSHGSLPLPQLECDQFADTGASLQVLPQLHHLLEFRRVPRFVPDGTRPLVAVDHLESLKGPCWNRHGLLSFNSDRVDTFSRLTSYRAFLG